MVTAMEDAKIKPEDVTYNKCRWHINTFKRCWRDYGDKKKALGEGASKKVLVSSDKE